MPKYFDTHAHVNFSAYKDDADAVIKRALDGSMYIINVGTKHATSEQAVVLANQYSRGVYATVGLHPIHTTASFHDEAELDGQSFTSAGESYSREIYLPLAQDPKTVAIGEVGLDYHHWSDGDDIEVLKAKQRETFLGFIALANEVDKPLMIHCWDAYDELLEILQSVPVSRKGVVHSFIGGFRTARRFVELGYLIGLNGIVTYTRDFDRLIKEVPLESIVSETDCPYLAPAERKGERNEPLYVREVVRHIADVKQLPEAEVAVALSTNAQRVFGLV